MHFDFMHYSGIMHKIEFQVNLIKSGKIEVVRENSMANVKTNEFPQKIQILPPVGYIVQLNSILCIFDFMHFFGTD